MVFTAFREEYPYALFFFPLFEEVLIKYFELI